MRLLNARRPNIDNLDNSKQFLDAKYQPTLLVSSLTPTKQTKFQIMKDYSRQQSSMRKKS